MAVETGQRRPVLLAVPAVAAELSTTKDFVYEAIQRGELRAVQLGNSTATTAGCRPRPAALPRGARATQTIHHPVATTGMVAGVDTSFLEALA